MTIKNLLRYLVKNGFDFLGARAIVQATEGKSVNCPGCGKYMVKEWNDELLRWEWMCWNDHDMEMICQFKDIDTSKFSWREIS